MQTPYRQRPQQGIEFFFPLTDIIINEVIRGSVVLEFEHG